MPPRIQRSADGFTDSAAISHTLVAAAIASGLLLPPCNCKLQHQGPSAAHVINQNESDWIRMNQSESEWIRMLCTLIPSSCKQALLHTWQTCRNCIYFFCHLCNIYIHTTWCPAPVFIVHVRACTLPQCHLARPSQCGSGVGCNDRVVQPLGGVAGGRCNGHIIIRKQCVRTYLRSHSGPRRLCNEGGASQNINHVTAQRLAGPCRSEGVGRGPITLRHKARVLILFIGQIGRWNTKHIHKVAIRGRRQ